MNFLFKMPTQLAQLCSLSDLEKLSLLREKYVLTAVTGMPLAILNGKTIGMEIINFFKMRNRMDLLEGDQMFYELFLMDIELPKEMPKKLKIIRIDYGKLEDFVPCREVQVLIPNMFTLKQIQAHIENNGMDLYYVGVTDFDSETLEITNIGEQEKYKNMPIVLNFRSADYYNFTHIGRLPPQKIDNPIIGTDSPYFNPYE